MDYYPSTENSSEMKKEHEIFFEEWKKKIVLDGENGRTAEKIIQNNLCKHFGVSEAYPVFWNGFEESEKKHYYQSIKNNFKGGGGGVKEKTVEEIKNALPVFNYPDWISGGGKSGQIQEFPDDVFDENGKLLSEWKDRRRSYWRKSIKRLYDYVIERSMYDFLFEQDTTLHLYQNRKTIKFGAIELKNKAWGTPNKYLTIKTEKYETSGVFTGVGITAPLDYKGRAKSEVGDVIAHQAFLVMQAFEKWRLMNVINQVHNLPHPYLKEIAGKLYGKCDESVYEFNMRVRDRFFGFMQKEGKDPIDKMINMQKTLLVTAEKQTTVIDSLTWALGIPDDIPFSEIYKDENRDYYLAGPDKNRGFRNKSSIYDRKNNKFIMINKNRVYKLHPINSDRVSDGIRPTTSTSMIFRTNYFPTFEDAIGSDGTYCTDNLNIRVFDEQTGNYDLVRFNDRMNKNLEQNQIMLSKIFFDGQRTRGGYQGKTLESVVMDSCTPFSPHNGKKTDENMVKRYFDTLFKSMVCNKMMSITTVTVDKKKPFLGFKLNYDNVKKAINTHLEGQTGITVTTVPDTSGNFQKNWIDELKKWKVDDEILSEKFLQNELPLPYNAMYLREGIYECDDFLLGHQNVGKTSTLPWTVVEKLDSTRLFIMIDIQGGMINVFNNYSSGIAMIPNANIRKIKRKCVATRGLFIFTKLCDDVTNQNRGNPLYLTGKYPESYKNYIRPHRVDCTSHLFSTYTHYKPTLDKLIRKPRMNSQRYEANIHEPYYTFPRSYIASQYMFDPQTKELKRKINDTGMWSGIDWKRFLKNK